MDTAPSNGARSRHPGPDSEHLESGGGHPGPGGGPLEPGGQMPPGRPARRRPGAAVVGVVVALALFAAGVVIWGRAGQADSQPAGVVAAGQGAAAEGWILNDPALAKQQAVVQKKRVLVDFWASWCGWCRRMDSETYADPRVKTMLDAGYVRLKIDVDKMPEFQQQFGVQGLPTTIVLDTSGKEIGRATGFEPTSQFLPFLADPTGTK